MLQEAFKVHMLRPEWKITRNHWQPDDRTLFRSHYFKENKYREQVNAPVRRCTSKAGSFQQLPASGVLQTLSGQCRDTVDFGFRPHTWAPAPHAPSEPVSPQHREGERPGLGQGRWWMRSLHISRQPGGFVSGGRSLRVYGFRTSRSWL